MQGSPVLRAAAVALVDLALVLAFAAIGRVSHGEDLGFGGLARTVWPFAAAWLLAWVGIVSFRRRRERCAGLGVGVRVWAVVVLVGLVLRHATGGGVQPSFVVVTAVALGVFLLGWRGVAAAVDRSRGRHPVPVATRRS